MNNLNRNLLLGYFISKEYLKGSDIQLGVDKIRFNKYAYSQAIIYLSLPYSFHFSGFISICCSRFLSESQAILFFVLISSFLISLYLFNLYFEKKYSRDVLVDYRSALSEERSKKLLKYSSLFFLLNLLIWILIEIPATFLF